ncbi:SMP-30/gluconolactonase/LRE family protein [Lacunimicrobium album]
MRSLLNVAVTAGLFFSSLEAVDAGGPIDHSKEVQLIRSEFGLCDGSAWSNWNQMYVPDVKEGKLYVYKLNRVKSDQPGGAETIVPVWEEVSSGQGKFSSTCYQLGELYAVDNPAAKIVKSRNGKQFTTVVTFEDQAKPNDLDVDGDGNIYVTMTKEGQVRKVSPDGNVTVFAEGLNTPNGITLSPDLRTLYVSESKTGRIVKMAIGEDGNAGPVAEFAKLEAGPNGPQGDGMCVDRAGNVYCAGYDSIFVFDADGKAVDRLKMPARPINCTFAGFDGDQLYISTMGGMYMQPMLAYGVHPQKAARGELAERQGNRPSTVIPEDIEAHLDVTYYQNGPRKVLMDVFVPKTPAGPKPCLVLVHGGAWLKGDKKQFRSLAIMLAEKGYVTASIEYRLGFEEKFPAGIQDCFYSVEFLTKHASEYQIDVDRMGAVGGSAGGHLVGLMATGWNEPMLRAPDADLNVSVRVKAAVDMAGPLDIASGFVEKESHRGMTSNATNWIGASIDEKPEMYHLADATEKVTSDDPPILFITGSKDNPGRDHHAMEQLKAAGVWTNQILHQDAVHGHWNSHPWIERVVEDIDQFMREQMKIK